MPSFHNARIAAILDDMHVRYQEEVTVPNLYGVRFGSLRFDFYLPPTCYQPELYLEVQDASHYGSLFGRGLHYPEHSSFNLLVTTMHDLRKTLWCKEHGVPLVHLPASLSDTTARAFLQDVVDFFLSSRERIQMSENDPAYGTTFEPLPETIVNGPYTHFQRTLTMFGIHPPRQLHPPEPARERGEPLKLVPFSGAPDSKRTKLRKVQHPRLPPIKLDFSAIMTSSDSDNEEVNTEDVQLSGSATEVSGLPDFTPN
jgi:hypothetical protein